MFSWTCFKFLSTCIKKFRNTTGKRLVFSNCFLIPCAKSFSVFYFSELFGKSESKSKQLSEQKKFSENLEPKQFFDYGSSKKFLGKKISKTWNNLFLQQYSCPRKQNKPVTLFYLTIQSKIQAQNFDFLLVWMFSIIVSVGNFHLLGGYSTPKVTTLLFERES